MVAKPSRMPKSFTGFTTPLHRLSPEQRLAEIAARTRGDDYRASLEAGRDFQIDAKASAEAEAAANPGVANLFTPQGLDAEITRRTKGRSQRDTLNAAWDVLAERDAAAEAMKQGGIAAPPLAGFQPGAPSAPSVPGRTPLSPHVAFDPAIWLAEQPPIQQFGTLFDRRPMTQKWPSDTPPMKPIPAATLRTSQRARPGPTVLAQRTQVRPSSQTPHQPTDTVQMAQQEWPLVHVPLTIQELDAPADVNPPGKIRPPPRKPHLLPDSVSPVPNPKIRDDVEGKGFFGASREKFNPITGKIEQYPHRALDIESEAGGRIKTPVDGKITKYGLPYTGEKYRYVEIETDDGHRVRMFYVKPLIRDGERLLRPGARIEKGQVIGTQQDIERRKKAWIGRMKNHVHIEVFEPGRYEKGQQIDPTSWFKRWSSQ